MTYEQFARMLTLMGPSDLWTVERAARHWGVSASRARAILSSRHIHRVSGYPAQAIKAVTLRQGARTDLKTANHLVPAAQAFTMAETGAAIGETEDERARLRIFFEFLRGADETGTSALDLIVDEPALIGEHRFDALLAAAAEYISARWGRPGPLWSVSIERFLDTAWWVSDLPSARAFAAVWTPAPFRRRGIYLDRHDLTSDGVCVMPEPVFNRTELQRAFTALAAKLERRGVVGQVHVVGGAAMLLAYNSRVTTRDIDALFSTDGPMLEAIREVADEMGWPRTWLNNQASGYVSRRLGRSVDMSNFTPNYLPWDERLCAVPNGDLFKTLASGAASVVTDQIETFTEKGILCKSGREIEADIIVTATGLNIQMLGGMRLIVDGAEYQLPEKMTYKGVLLENAPNLAWIIGYTNASWTLKSDIAGAYLCRLLRHMADNGYTVATPRDAQDCALDVGMFDQLNSGYVKRGQDIMPRQGSKHPWRVLMHYEKDAKILLEDPIDDGVLHFAAAAQDHAAA